MIDILVRILSALLMIALPIGVFFFVRDKMGATWRFIRIGATTFVASQVVHIPFNMIALPLLLNVLGLSTIQDASGSDLWILSAFLGLSAGICEEVARYVVYRFWLTNRERTRKNAVTLGFGHGGCEAILVGLAALIALVQMIALRHADLSKFFPPEKVEQAQVDISYYWSLSWYEVMMQPVERIPAMVFHMSASVFVLQVFLRNELFWLAVAIAFHTAIDIFAVLALVHKWNALYVEAALSVAIIPLALAIVFHFRHGKI